MDENESPPEVRVAKITLGLSAGIIAGFLLLFLFAEFVLGIRSEYVLSASLWGAIAGGIGGAIGAWWERKGAIVGIVAASILAALFVIFWVAILVFS